MLGSGLEIVSATGVLLEIWIPLCAVATGSSCRNFYAGVQASFNCWPGPIFFLLFFFFLIFFNRNELEMPKQTFHILIRVMVALQTKHCMLWPVEWFGWFLTIKKEGSCDLLYLNANYAWPLGCWRPALSLGQKPGILASPHSAAKCRRICAHAFPPSSGGCSVRSSGNNSLLPASGGLWFF